MTKIWLSLHTLYILPPTSPPPILFIYTFKSLPFRNSPPPWTPPLSWLLDTGLDDQTASDLRIDKSVSVFLIPWFLRPVSGFMLEYSFPVGELTHPELPDR